MDNETKPKSAWGGFREGAGRKKKYAASFKFSATQEVADILSSIEGSRSDFINSCILKAMKY